MIRLFVNEFDDCVILEDCPAGDESREIVNLDKEDFRVLVSICQLESYKLARACGALYLAGLREGRKACLTRT